MGSNPVAAQFFCTEKSDIRKTSLKAGLALRMGVNTTIIGHNEQLEKD